MARSSPTPRSVPRRAPLLPTAQAAHLSVGRTALLNEPTITGDEPFLGDCTLGCPGTMIVEYAVAAAFGELVAGAAPTGLQSVTLSRGLEEGASFAAQAATRTLASVEPLRASSLPASCSPRPRALGSRPAVPPSLAPVLAAVAEAVPQIDDREDRDLTDDLAAWPTSSTSSRSWWVRSRRRAGAARRRRRPTRRRRTPSSADGVLAHPPQRRAVGVHRDRPVHGAVEPVDVVGAEAEDLPAVDRGLDGSASPTARLCSVRVPLTTATAPEEMSWSCQPVSFSGVQHSSQTSTWASRCSET